MPRNFRCLFLFLLVLFPAVLPAQQRTICSTPAPDEATIRWIEEMIRMAPDRQLAETVRIPVVFHNIYSGKKGKVADQNIEALIATLNEGFAGTPFEFFLSKVDRIKNQG